MKVILLSELRGKGGEGDVVDVAQGFAENYLFPNKIAQAPATPGNIKQLEERRHNIEKREAERIAAAEATKAALDGKSVTVDAKIGEEGQLFGSVTPAQIADAIQAQLGLEVDRKRVGRGNNIKTSGKHAVEVNLYREITATVNVLVGVRGMRGSLQPGGVHRFFHRPYLRYRHYNDDDNDNPCGGVVVIFPSRAYPLCIFRPRLPERKARFDQRWFHSKGDFIMRYIKVFARERWRTWVAASM